MPFNCNCGHRAEKVAYIQYNSFTREGAPCKVRTIICSNCVDNYKDRFDGFEVIESIPKLQKLRIEKP